jgi:tetratricopeptide (TPR) repeat protein
MESHAKAERRVVLAAGTLCVIAAVLPYLGVLDAPFVFDDIKLVQENTQLREGWDTTRVLSSFDVTSRQWADEELRPNYRPMRFLSYFIDAQLSRLVFGASVEEPPPPFFFHLSNVLLHALNAVLVFVCTRRLFAFWGHRTDSVFVPLVTSLLFALHPVQTEAVTYVSGRRDVLSTAFFFAALALYLGPASSSRSRAGVGVVAFVGAPLCLVSGLLSKEMVVTLPAVVLLAEWLRGGRPHLSRVVLQVVLWTLALGHTFLNLSGGDLVAGETEVAGSGVALTASRYVCRYLALLLFPVSQSIDYSFAAITPSSGWGTPWTTGPAVLFVVAMLALAGWGLTRRRFARARVDTEPATAGPIGHALLAFGLFWFVGTLVPVLQFVPIAERFAERFTYLPSVGIFLLAAFALDFLRRMEGMLGWGIAAVLSVLLVVGTVHRNGDWESPLRLWTAAVEAQPRAARAHLGRANALKGEGRLEEAAHEYSAALDIFSEEPELPLHHGFILQSLTLRGQAHGLLAEKDPALLARAIADYRQVLSLDDTDGVAIAGSSAHTVIHFDLAGFLLRAGETAEAKAEYERVITIGHPTTLVAAARYYLAKVALAEGDPEGARRLYTLALEETPDDDPANFTVAAELVQLLLEQKDYDTAWTVIEAALDSVGTGERRLHLLMRLAEITDRRGDLSGTIERLKGILEEDPSYLPAHLTLAGIEANLGDLDAAAKHYREVLAQAPAHAEARRGLREVEIRRRAGTAGPDADPAARERALLRGLLAKGQAHFDEGAYVAAAEVFAKLTAKADALGDSELQALAYSEWARVQEKFGETETALRYLEKALERDQEHPVALLRMADLQLKRLNDLALARAYYERYLQAAKGTPQLEPRVYFNLANLVGRDEPRLAVDYCLQARDSGFDVPALDRSLGYYYADLESWEKALEAFTRYLERAPDGDAPRKAAVRAFVKSRVLPHIWEN